MLLVQQLALIRPTPEAYQYIDVLSPKISPFELATDLHSTRIAPNDPAGTAIVSFCLAMQLVENLSVPADWFIAHVEPMRKTARGV